MFKRRDIPPVLLLLLLIILVMLTLSQILVVHNGRYGKNIHSMRKLQLELRQMDINLHTMMMQNVPSIELNRRLLQNSINAHRVAQIIAEASQPDRYSNNISPSGRRTRPRCKNLTRRFSDITGSISISHSRSFNRSIYDDADDSEMWTGGDFASRDYHLRNGSHQDLQQTTIYSETVANTLRIHANSNSVEQGNKLPQNLLSKGEEKGINSSLIYSNDSSNHNFHFTNHNSSGNYEVNRTEDIGPLGKVLPLPHNPTSNKPYCPPVPPEIKGRIFINFEHKHDYTEADVLAQNPELLGGGAWRPKECIARHKVAIIIPYRDRKEHLTILLSHLHPMLQRQQLDYRIYIVEQFGEYTFNKARIMNIAFVEALKQYSFQCFVFHDVDLVPEDDRNMYSCPVQPRHMSVAIDEMGYKLAYQELVGGVLNMRTEHFQSVNGYSNLYWGWGAEDDDMAYRIMHVGLKITRPPESVARYKMIKHTKKKKVPTATLR